MQETVNEEVPHVCPMEEELKGQPLQVVTGFRW